MGKRTHALAQRPALAPELLADETFAPMPVAMPHLLARRLCHDHLRNPAMFKPATMFNLTVSDHIMIAHSFRGDAPI